MPFALLDALFGRTRPRRSRAAAGSEGGTSAPRSPAGWAERRAPQREHDRALSPFAAAWVAALPGAAQPRQTVLRYPRIVNRLALCWRDAELCARLFDELMVDRRGGRQGFPREVASELLMLRGLQMRVNLPPLPAGLAEISRLRGRAPASAWDGLSSLSLGDRASEFPRG